MPEVWEVPGHCSFAMAHPAIVVGDGLGHAFAGLPPGQFYTFFVTVGASPYGPGPYSVPAQVGVYLPARPRGLQGLNPIPGEVDRSIPPPTHVTARFLSSPAVNGPLVDIRWSQPAGIQDYCIWRAPSGGASFSQSIAVQLGGRVGEVWEYPPPGHTYTYFVTASNDFACMGPYSPPAGASVYVPRP
jgi:hypothetical protein